MKRAAKSGPQRASPRNLRLQLPEPRERRGRQRPLADRAQRRLQFADIGEPDLGGGQLRVGDHEAHRHLGQARRMALAHHRLQPSGARHVLRIVRARADRLDHGQAERIALRASRQRAARERADADGADALLRRAIEDAAVVLRRIGRRDRLAGARVQRVVRHLRAVERAGCDQREQRIGLADRREADEARLALLARAIERRHDIAEHLVDAHRHAVGARRDRVVQLEHIDMVALEPLQARLQRSRDRGADVGTLGRHAHLRGQDDVRLQAGEHAADILLRRAVAVGRARYRND